jgi:predicted GIY-YIG superfamily endonuclease
VSRYIRHGGFGTRGNRVNILQTSTGVFFVDYREKATGKRITRSLETADLNEAKKLIGDIVEQQRACRPTRGTKGETVLYVIQRGDDGPIKVGISRNVNQRVKDLQTGSAERLNVLRVYKMADVERAIHAELERKSRLEGEWFPADLLSLVDRFFNVDFDVTWKRARVKRDAITAKAEYLMSAGLL